MAEQTYDFTGIAPAPAPPPGAGYNFTGIASDAPDFRATNEPPSAALKAAAYGKDAASLALDALPGVGAVIGGALATPYTLGGGTLGGSAIGAAAGLGVRDLLRAAAGFQQPTTALNESGRMARMAAESYLTGKILPALVEGIKNPKATVGDVYGELASYYRGLPKAVKAFLPDIEAYRAALPASAAKAPAAILQRPGWQTWEEAAKPAAPSPVVAPPVSATSMAPGPPVPAASWTPGTIGDFIKQGAPAAAAAEPVVAAPVAAPGTAAPASSPLATKVNAAHKILTDAGMSPDKATKVVTGWIRNGTTDLVRGARYLANMFLKE